MNHWPKIYYISQGATPDSHLFNIENVCKAGCKLVQLRLKDIPHDIVMSTAETALKICNQYDSKLIINDYIEIAEALPVFGLHLGKTDTDLRQAKLKLSEKIVGGTANTFEDCMRLANANADYIGLGPFQFTKTKSNLEPMLGKPGYRAIITKLRSLKIDIPIYAIGGIQEKDIAPLIDLGLAGVAVSGLLSNKQESQIKHIINI